MARGRRGGRRAQRRRNQPQAPARPSARPTRRGRAGPAQDLPTEAPGAADAPAGSSVFGGGSVQVNPGAGTVRGQRRQRNRGGPRSLEERERGGGLRARAVAYDFRYVGSDLRWILGTTAASVGAVLALWVLIRL